MSEPQTESLPQPVGPPPAEFRWSRLAAWLPLCLIHGTAVAWLAYGIQKHFAPLGLFPILVGLALGITLAGMMRLTQIAGRSTILLGTLVAAAVAVSGQHYFSFLEQRETAMRQAAQFRLAAETHPGLVRGTPPAPASGVIEYLRWQAIRGRPIAGKVIARRAWAWASWGLDAGLTLAAALLVIIPATRRPYCNQCRSWYGPVRRGRLDLETARKVAEALGLETPAEIQAVSYRVLHCQGGCGKAGFELCWELPTGRPKIKRIWVSAEDRVQLEEVIPSRVSNTTEADKT